MSDFFIQWLLNTPESDHVERISKTNHQPKNFSKDFEPYPDFGTAILSAISSPGQLTILIGIDAEGDYKNPSSLKAS
jgi:hypothetical protein